MPAELFDAGGELRRDIFPLAGPVDEHAKIVCLALRAEISSTSSSTRRRR